jgi:hypothetical protein
MIRFVIALLISLTMFASEGLTQGPPLVDPPTSGLYVIINGVGVGFNRDAADRSAKADLKRSWDKLVKDMAAQGRTVTGWQLYDVKRGKMKSNKYWTRIRIVVFIKERERK